MYYLKKSILVYFIFLSFLISCQKKEKDVEEKNPKLTVVSLKYPNYFPDTKYNLKSYPLTKEGIELGKMLFYDPILSGDSTIACASCHLQKNAFSDSPKRFSNGVNGKQSQRNSFALFNLIFYPYFFADGGVTHFDFIALAPMDNDREMNIELKEFIKKLNEHPIYSKKFQEVFQVEKITTKEFLYAINQFLSTLISANSDYDKYLQGAKNALSSDALEGLKIFEQKCQSCHKAPLFTDFSFRNIGLDNLSKDMGRMRITTKENDRGKFKVPSLRNLTLTAPYMQDGRFQTLEEVLNFYDTGVKNSPNLDPLLKQNKKLGIPLSPKEKEYLLAFLKGLEDKEFTNNPAFVNPF